MAISSKSVKFVIAALAVLLFANVCVVAYNFTATKPFDPLRIGSGQTILNSVSEKRKVVYDHSDVLVRAKKCVVGDEPIDVVGTVSWRLETGFETTIIETSQGSAKRKPGCIETVFRNEIPPEVKNKLNSFFDSGIKEVKARIQGSESPISKDGEQGVVRVWSTEPFFIKRGP